MSADPTGSPEVCRLIGDVYDCVLDSDRWPEVLGQIRARAGGCAASLNVHSIPALDADLIAEHGTDPVYSARYVAEYGRINPLLTPAACGLAEGELRVLSRAADPEAYRASRFYREWVAPQGWGDWAAGVLQRGPARLAMLAVARPDAAGPFGAADLGFLKLILPHVGRAVTLGRLLAADTARRDGLAALIDRLAVAAVLVDPSGRIVHANDSAEALLVRGTLLRAEGGRLCLTDPQAARELAAVLASPKQAEPRIVPVTAGGTRRVLSLLPASEDSGGLAIVLATLPVPPQALPGDLLARAYGLTPAEMRVLQPLLAGSTLQDIAGDLGIAHRTVKAHLHRLFEKTGTARQSDLVREVLCLLPPLRR